MSHKLWGNMGNIEERESAQKHPNERHPKRDRKQPPIEGGSVFHLPRDIWKNWGEIIRSFLGDRRWVRSLTKPAILSPGSPASS